MNTYKPIGTVSCATMRREDLIPAFVSELQYIRDHHKGLRREHRAELTATAKRMERDGYYESEESAWDLEWLFDTLDSYAMPYFYFGAHMGDGADYGFWLHEDFEREFEGLKVSDLAEIPANYRGEVLLISDHGNMTLYLKTARKLTEIWAIV